MADGSANAQDYDDDQESSASDNRIAIIGRSGRFASAANIRQFWRIVSDGRIGTRFLTDAELLGRGVSRATLMDPTYVKAANMLSDMESFDAGFFGFSPAEARILDPQHRHFLECSWEALEDAGQMPEKFDGRVGIYAGCGMQAYLPFNLLTNPDLVEEEGLFLLRHTGNDKDFLATRASYLLNLTGPSVTVQTACSTSLVAIHTAANALLAMECDMALAGGVSIDLPHGVGYHFSGEVESPDGLCRAFDDKSEGTVFGSGAAVVVLRRYEDALADGDDIKAVILGTAVNNDGASKANYFAPSVDGQVEAASEAVALAGVPPGSISYIEAHGTGTPIGDPIELEALREVYGEAGPGEIGIGSVKTNIGHTDTAAGAAGVIKVVEAMRHKRLPASLNFTTPNRRFDFANSPFRVVADAQDWTPKSGPRRAAVNSLGVGGTNAHIVLEEGPERPPATDRDDWRIFTYSARDTDAIGRTARLWASYMDAPEESMADIAHTLRHGRRQFDARLAIAARSAEQLQAALSGTAPSLAHSAMAAGSPPKIVFLFPGGGAQYPGAGAQMMEQSPVFAAAVEDCFRALPEDAPEDLRHVMLDSTSDDKSARQKMGRSRYAIPALFILEYAYARLWDSYGVKPDMILAHSVGEYAGAAIAGVMSLSDVLRVLVLRGRVMDEAPEGAMTSVPAGEETVRRLIGDALDIAALNAPEASVVSGTVEDIRLLERKLEGTPQAAKRIKIDVAAHSRQLDGQLERFREGFAGGNFGRASVPLVSSMKGAMAAGDDMTSADYWVAHLRNTVRFTDAVKCTLDQADCIVIEVGPGQTLGPLVEIAQTDRPARAVLASAPRFGDATPEMGAFMTALGALWAEGADVTLPPTDGRRVSLPTYAFDKTQHWIEPGQGARANASETIAEPLALTRTPQIADWFTTQSWADSPSQPHDVDLSGTWLVFGMIDGLSGAVLSGLEKAFGSQVQMVRPGTEFARNGADFTIRPNAPEDYASLIAALPDIDKRRILHLWHASMPDRMHGFNSAFHLTRALQMADAGQGTELTFASSGIRAGTESGAEAALLLGPVRVGPREVSGLSTKLVDLDLSDLSRAADFLLREAASDTADDLISQSKTKRLVQRSATIAPPKSETMPARLRENGVYVITGGTTGVGLELARWLTTHFKARTALLSRSADKFPTQTLAELSTEGGEAMALSVDVTNAAAVQEALTAIRAKWGAINGVIHGAGGLADALLSEKTVGQTEQVIAPKLRGAQALSEALPDGSLDVFVVFSSSSVALGSAGQTDYVAANAALEAVANARSDGLVLAWGTWRDIGMADRVLGVAETEDGPHPLLGAREAGKKGRIRFRRRFDPGTDWVAGEHVIDDNPVLPGTAYMEMIHAAALELVGARAFEIRSLSFLKPMVFQDWSQREVSVVLEPRRDGYDVTIESKAGQNSVSQTHAQGQIIATLNRDAELPESLRVIPDLFEPADLEAASMQGDLIDFGARWLNLQSIGQYDTFVEGRFELAEAFRADIDDGHKLHAAILDNAMTVGLLAVSDKDKMGRVFAPMSVERVRVLGPLDRKVRAVARRLRMTDASVALFDVMLSDPDGTPLVLFEGLAMRGVPLGELGDVGASQTLPEALLSKGIRAEDAPEIFARAFNTQARYLSVSALPLKTIRLAMTEARRTGFGRMGESSGAGDALTTPVEAEMAEIWQEILGASGIGPQDSFFDLGGHSLSAVRMFSRIQKRFGVSLPLATLFDAPTLGQLSLVVARSAGLEVDVAGDDPAALVSPENWSPLVEISAGKQHIKPLYCVHGAGGNVLNFRALSSYLHADIPFYALRALGSDGDLELDSTLEAMADRYFDAIRAHQPIGPYRLSGYSGGGTIALEIANRLVAAGEEVEHLFFFDTLAPHIGNMELSFLQKLWAARSWDIEYAMGWLARKRQARENREASNEISDFIEAGQRIPDELNGVRLTRAFEAAQMLYRMQSYDGDVTLFKARNASTLFLRGGPTLGWKDYITGTLEIQEFDCDHFTLMEDPTIEKIGAILTERLLY